VNPALLADASTVHERFDDGRIVSADPASGRRSLWTFTQTIREIAATREEA